MAESRRVLLAYDGGHASDPRCATGRFDRRRWWRVVGNVIARLTGFGFLVALILANAILVFPTWGCDFGSFIASGRAVSQGLDPYAIYPLTCASRYPNMNPPALLPLFGTVAWLDLWSLLQVWRLISVAIYGVVLWLLARAYPDQATPSRLLWAVAISAFLETIEVGQIYAPLLLLSVGAWLLLRRGRRIPAGLLIGIVIAIKPNFVFWPLLLLVAGYPAVALAAFGVAGLLQLAPLLSYGPVVYSRWLAAGVHLGVYGLPVDLARQLQVPWLGPVLAATLIGAAAFWAWRTSPRVLDASALALVVGLIVFPISGTGYFLWLLPVFFRRSWNWPFRIVAVMLLVPWQLTSALTLPWYLLMLGFSLVGVAISVGIYPKLATRLRLPKRGSSDSRSTSSVTAHP